MIHVDPKPKGFDRQLTMAEHLCNSGAETAKERALAAIELVKTLPIRGCITGSCWLPDFDPDEWGGTPDIDIFVFSENDLVQAITLAENTLFMTPGTGTPKSEEQERWKIRKLLEDGLNYKLGISTYKFYEAGVILNFTYKQVRHEGRWVPCMSTPDVLMSFDMSIVMQGYDIPSHTMFDLRPDDVSYKVAVPNPLRRQDYIAWTVAKWVRQFDRVIKYYARGYDTRPMAKAYVGMIDECLEKGSLFESEESVAAFEAYAQDFLAKKEVIVEWLEAHKEDEIC